ncbi:MAG: ATP-binding protein [Candidatus Stygibacter frigidus]|nr:ATP-binding protein [Candidatus Stygibacter frigidus]
MYIFRHLQEKILNVSGTFPALLLSGARQVGKTTLLKHLKENNRTYLSLDDPEIKELAVNDPALFLQRFPPPLFIDEIQYAPQLFPHLKMYIDNSQQNGLFWLSGSQQFSLMKNVSESLAGRIAILNLYGLSQAELNNSPGKMNPFIPDIQNLEKRAFGKKEPDLIEIYQQIFKGQMPKLHINNPPDLSTFFSSYIQTYIQRDVRSLINIGDEMAFFRFLRAIAARTGQMLNKSELARDAAISPKTAESWLSILRASGLIYLLEPYFKNLTKRLIKSPKLYFLDTGLCAYLTGWHNWETLEAGALNGAILETWVVSEIIKNYNNNGIPANFYYLRTKDGSEIDLLIELNGVIHPLEIKKTAHPTKNDIRHFHLLQKNGGKIAPGGVICLCKHLLPIDENNYSIPVGIL